MEEGIRKAEFILTASARRGVVLRVHVYCTDYMSICADYTS